MYNNFTQRLAPKAVFNKRLSFKQERTKMKTVQDLLAFKDKILTLCLWPSLGLAELTFKAMHWTTEARLKTAIGNMLCKSSRYVHFKNTGTHPIDEIMKDAEASRHRKKRS